MTPNVKKVPTKALRKIEGRVVVDASSFFHANPDESKTLANLNSASIGPHIDVEDNEHGEIDYYDDWSDSQQKRNKNKVDNAELEKDRKLWRLKPTFWLFKTGSTNSSPAFHLTEDQLLLCATRLRGYSLKFKQWVSFDVDNIIEGKGMGIIMLLVGQPSTGKTLTAEAVAARVRKPLYVLSAGELGQDASSVESQLAEVLEIAEKWNAVLLFDECDVFLQERSTSNVAHNEIVAVFLRLLEYYRGIMLMTTNRADAIDRAFQSRIHLTLHYPDFDLTAKEQIWRHFTSQVESDETLTDDIYHRLAQLPMNGRQIKNIVKTSALLAHKEKTKFGVQHTRTVPRYCVQHVKHAARIVSLWVVLFVA